MIFSRTCVWKRCCIALLGGILFSTSSLSAMPDIDVMYIERTPRITFNKNEQYGRAYWYNKQRGWPVAGQAVTYVAHLKNAGTANTGSFTYAWKIDGAVVKKGTAQGIQPSPHNGLIEQTFSYTWNWSSQSRTIEFIADTANLVGEVCENNNRLAVRTNALTVGFWVERSRYSYYNTHQYSHAIQYGFESNSFEDWAQRQMREWNRMLQESGIQDRVSMDRIVLVNDDALPLNGGFYDTNAPDLNDRTVDMEWGFPTTDWSGNPFDRIEDNPGRPSYTDPHIFDWATIHELNHARTIEDLYGINVLLEHNDDILQKPYIFPIPLWFDHIYYNKGSGIMTGGYHDVPDYCPYLRGAWNSIAGLRAIGGNTNGTSMPTYPADLPANMDLRILARSGANLPGAVVKMYTYEWDAGAYGKNFGVVPQRTMTTTSGGVADLGPDPYGIAQWQDFAVRDKLILLVEISYRNQKSMQFVEASEFIRAYHNGNHTSYANPVPTNIILNQSPNLGITMPLNNQEIAGTRPVGVAVYNQSLQIDHVEFYVGPTLYHTDYSAPYIWGDNDPEGNGGWNTLYDCVNGVYTVTVKAYSGSNQLLETDAVTVTVNNDAPKIVALTHRQLDAGSVCISWQTNRTGTSQVEYGVSSSYTNSTPVDFLWVNEHSMVLAGLTPGALYHYRVRTVDYNAREILSSDQTFQVLANPPVNIINLGPENATTPVTISGLTALFIYQWPQAWGSGWQPANIKISATPADGKELTGISMSVAGQTKNLSGWYDAVLSPYTGQNIYITVTAPSNRSISVTWWGQN